MSMNILMHLRWDLYELDKTETAACGFLGCLYNNLSILASSKIYYSGNIFDPDESLGYFSAPTALNGSDGFCLTE